MAGSPNFYLPPAFVAIPLPLTMPCAAQPVPFQLLGELQDLTADLLSEVCHEVCIEPHLQPLTRESPSYSTANVEENARLDVRARGFWVLRQQSVFFDVRVFHPNTPSYRSLQLETCYRRHEDEKRRAENMNKESAKLKMDLSHL